MPNNHLQFQLQELNPPVPPQAVALMADPVPLEVRRLRVQHGSKRKRDLAAVQMAEELALLGRVEAGSDCESLRAWALARRSLRKRLGAWSVPYRSYLRRLRPVGREGGTLVLAGGGDFTRERFSHLILEALTATGSDFKQVRFVSGGEG